MLPLTCLTGKLLSLCQLPLGPGGRSGQKVLLTWSVKSKIQWSVEEFYSQSGNLCLGSGRCSARGREKWCRSFKAKHGKHLCSIRKSPCIANGLVACELVSTLARVDRLLLEELAGGGVSLLGDGGRGYGVQLSLLCT